MSATIEISLPDALVKALGAKPGELPRRTLEALVIQSYRSGQLSHAQVSEALGLDRWQTDAFLKTAQAFRPWDPEEWARERRHGNEHRGRGVGDDDACIAGDDGGMPVQL